MNMHTLSILVQNRPGVLTRCAGLFRAAASISIRRPWAARRSVTEPDHDPGGTAPSTRSTRCRKQLYKLIDVLKVQELGQSAVELELCC